MSKKTKETYPITNKEEMLLHNLESGSKVINYHKNNFILLNNVE